MLVTTRKNVMPTRNARLQPVAYGIERSLDGGRIAIRYRLLVRERLHRAHRRQVLGGICRTLGQRILCPPRQAPHGTPVDEKRQHDQRDRNQHQRGQPGTRDEHHRQPADQHDDVADRLTDRRSGGRLDQCGIGGKPAHNLAGMGAIVKRRSELREVTEDVGPDIGDDALAQPIDQKETRRTGTADQEADQYQHQEVLIDESTDAIGETEVDHAPDRHRHGQHRHGRDNESDARQCEHPGMLQNIGPQNQQRTK